LDGVGSTAVLGKAADQQKLPDAIRSNWQKLAAFDGSSALIDGSHAPRCLGTALTSPAGDTIEI
jgi:hypothetical protein